MSKIHIALQSIYVGNSGHVRRLRRAQTKEERQLWQALRRGHFAGFKFRRQHPVGKYALDFYCASARLSVELDGFQHGLPNQQQHDEIRKQFLASEGVQELRFWNHQWQNNSQGVLLEIWSELHRRTGCVMISRRVEDHRFAPPDPQNLLDKPTEQLPQKHL